MRTLSGTHSNGFIAGNVSQYPNYLSIANTAFTGISASCTNGVITFSHSNQLPVGKNGNQYVGVGSDIVIYSCFAAGTGFSSTFPGGNIFNNERSSFFDIPNKSMQNIYEHVPVNASNKWRTTVSKGNPYETNNSDSVDASGYPTGCGGFGPAYSTMNSYTSLNGVYDNLIGAVSVSSNTYTINVNQINSLPGRAANPGWKFEAPLCSGNARVYIRPGTSVKNLSPTVGSANYVYGNWSHFDVNISGAGIPNRVANAQPSGLTVSGRTVSWQTSSTLVSAYIYLYKNGSVLRQGYIQDGNPLGRLGTGSLSYTIPSGDGSGSFVVYVANYSAVENNFTGYASISVNL